MNGEQGNKEELRRPQHLRTIIEKPSFTKEEEFALSANHQLWLGQKVTGQLKNLLDEKIWAKTEQVAQLAVSQSATDTVVRVTGAELNMLIEIKKVIYETEKFVRNVIGS